MKVFWSWQSDSLEKNGHHFVRDALERALHEVASDLELTPAERPEVDHDTKGAPGLVSIVDTLFEKIKNAAVFVGDLTYVGETPRGKLLPNPNVMIELGHAITSLGTERIILVTNSAHGGRPEDLPFDLRHRRAPIAYNLPDDATSAQRKDAQKAFVSALVPALTGCLGRVRTQNAQTSEYPAAPARTTDRSTWLAEGASISYPNTLSGGITTWAVSEEPRYYLRVVPANYNGDLRPRQVLSLPMNYRLDALRPYVSTESGSNEDGVVVVGLRRDQARQEKLVGATQWFETTSEVWSFSIASYQPQLSELRFLAHTAIAQGWMKQLDQTLSFLAYIGVQGPLRVEVGVTGLREVAWQDDFGDHPVTVRNEVYLQRSGPSWTRDKRDEFLAEAFNRLREEYHQEPLSVAEFLEYGQR